MNPARESVATETFGPYEVYERLGMGGMASVHRAKKRGPAGFERTVALKRMLSHLTEDRGFVESFVREAKVASLLVHPNIAQVYDFGRIGGIFYIAMEMVAGFDLRKLLRHAHKTGEAIPLGVILTILAELCDALDYAHSFIDETGHHLSIVHRDISPSNIIVAHTGHVKVIDFGIAKASSRQLHTETGMVKGKLGYMAPEAAMGMSVSAQSDMFSVGVTAWELVTALPLFSARTDFETMRKLREDAIAPPSRHNPACPARLDRLILASLAREPEHRITSARAFRTELDAIAQECGLQVSARAVGDWTKRLADVEATGRPPAANDPHRAHSPSGRQLPLPAPDVTAMTRPSKPTRPPTPLHRNDEDVALATEIWGEDNGTQGSSAPGVDFSMDSVPPIAAAAVPRIVTAPNVPPMPALTPSGGYVPPQLPVGSMPQERPKSKLPLIICGVLAIVAGVFGALLYARKSAPSGPHQVGLKFTIEPQGATVEIAGKEIGSGSPVETSVLPGVYSINIHKQGFKPWTTSLGVRDGEDQTINIVLDKEPEVVAIEQDTPAPTSPPPAPETQLPETPAPESPHPAHAPTKHGKAGHHEAKTSTNVEAQEPVKEPTKQEPAKQEPAKIDPPKQEPVTPPVVDTKPKTTPVVGANVVAKLSGDIPQLRGSGDGEVYAKACIDDAGHVTAVTIKKSPPDTASDLQRALMTWRYKPYMKGDKASPVCFPVSFRLVFKQ